MTPRLAAALLAAALLGASILAPASAQQPAARAPLLMEGKKTLFQRVLTRPEARLHDRPNGTAAKDELPPLSALYVYARRTEGGAEWLEVGRAADGGTLGWLKGAETVAWKQTLTLAFTNPANRERTLFFREPKPLQDLLESPERVQRAAALRGPAVAGQTPANSPVVSIEPATHIDITKRFYLLPILQLEETILATGQPARLVKVASITANKDDKGPVEPPKEMVNALRGFNAAIVFVIDTTTSMGPYIESTKQIVQRVGKAFEDAGVGDKVKFGLVAFRSSLSRTPALEYDAKVFVEPFRMRDTAYFMQQVRDLRATNVSSHDFSEDSMAGLVEAIDKVNWEPFAGRYIILISDAGNLKPSESKTGMDAAEVRVRALEKNIATYAVHLKTPAGAANHAYAEAKYRDLTTHPNAQQALYYGIDAGSVQQFQQTVETLARDLAQQVKDAAEGKLVPGRAPTPPAGAPPAAPSKPAEQAKADAQQIGHAMVLAYLGRQQGQSAPRFFEAWASDRDLVAPTTQALEVRLLLTKNQLSDLRETLVRVLEAGKRAQIDPKSFFDQLRSAAAAMSRDPSRVGRASGSKLGELGLINEYLDDLPYRSKLMAMTQDTWSSLSIAEQAQFLEEIESKIRLYQRLHDDVGAWTQLAPGGAPGDAVYPVPFEVLP